ncbi:MAG: hypothetical protein A2Z18_07760 [Armatimonadetes bacterium RBG_16_58_9]|nr:MAG: hypothetical protein A2Z18_07760 [Armatimonadetes bacterium RBG_16_58_9]
MEIEETIPERGGTIEAVIRIEQRRRDRRNVSSATLPLFNDLRPKFVTTSRMLRCVTSNMGRTPVRPIDTGLARCYTLARR